jgi:hypothetical protein
MSARRHIFVDDLRYTLTSGPEWRSLMAEVLKHSDAGSAAARALLEYMDAPIDWRNANGPTKTE